MPQLMRALNTTRKNNRLYVRLLASDAGAVVSEEPLSSLPRPFWVFEADRSAGDFVPLRNATSANGTCDRSSPRRFAHADDQHQVESNASTSTKCLRARSGAASAAIVSASNRFLADGYAQRLSARRSRESVGRQSWPGSSSGPQRWLPRPPPVPVGDGGGLRRLSICRERQQKAKSSGSDPAGKTTDFFFDRAGVHAASPWRQTDDVCRDLARRTRLQIDRTGKGAPSSIRRQIHGASRSIHRAISHAGTGEGLI
jgi:hypothetical protein